MPHSDSALRPWESAGFRHHDLACLHHAIDFYCDPSGDWYRRVPAVTSCVGVAYHPPSIGRQLLGGLIRLRIRWSRFTSNGLAPSHRGLELPMHGAPMERLGFCGEMACHS
jgi:hypothetical protein